MESNQKYNKRPRSYTEFRASYSDNKNNFNSTDKYFRRQSIIKYLIVAVFIAVVAVGAFLIADALISISEEPYVSEETTTQAVEKTDIDKKYFENQVTVPADEVQVDEDENDNDLRE